jgi:glycine/sarcosine N-methyltransferase
MTADVRQFYDDLAADYDAIFLDWDASVRRQAGIIEPLLGLAVPDSILDVAAGMGTQSIGLALRGHSVLARDLSPALVERGRREAARLGASLTFEVGDMRVAVAADAGRHAAVIAFDNALPHLDDDGALRDALAAARLALRSGGRFAASLRDYDALVATRPTMDPPRLFGDSPDRRVVLQVWSWAADAASYGLDHLILREVAGGWSLRARSTSYRALLRADLEAAAAAVGFVDLAWHLPDATGFYQPIFTAAAP